MVPELASDRAERAAIWLLGALETWILSLVYLAVLVAVCFPILVGSVTGALMLWERLGLDGPLGMLYFMGIGVLIMAEFTVLRKVMDGVGIIILRPER